MHFFNMRNFVFVIESEVDTSCKAVWQHVTQMKNVNAELMPWARMTYPDALSEIGDREVPTGKVLFKSIVLLFGFIPVDLHYLRLDKIEVGKAFYENSYSLQHHYWKHTRTLTPHNGKTLVRDELHFAPRVTLRVCFCSLYTGVYSGTATGSLKSFSGEIFTFRQWKEGLPFLLLPVCFAFNGLTASRCSLKPTPPATAFQAMLLAVYTKTANTFCG